MPVARYLTRDNVLALAQMLDVEACLARVLVDTERQSAGHAVRLELAPPGLPGVLALMPAFKSGANPALAAKVVSVFPANVKKGVPSHQGIAVLFDGEDGGIAGMVEAGALTEIRTAALTALATRTLARPGAARALFVGGGRQLLPHVQALSKIPSVTSLALWVRRTEAATSVAQELQAAGFDVEIETDLERAIAAADIITTLTSAAEPVIGKSWLKPGAHLNAIGSSTHGVREFDADIAFACDLFVDDDVSVKQLAGEFRGLSEYPSMTSLGSVLAGTASGRRDSKAITVFKSVGIGSMDLAAMQGLLALASSADVGQRLNI